MHIEKFKKGSVGQILAHIERCANEKTEQRNFGNKDIRKELSHLNYRLDEEKNSLENYHQILQRDNVKVQNRKDINTFCSACLTLPDDVEDKDREKFFQSAFDFLKNRYCRYDNLVSAWVHNDEKRSHLHFVFVPLCLDKRYLETKGKERYKVSAKEVITRLDLQTLHNDLNEHIKNALGYEVSILTEKEKLKDTELYDSEDIKKMIKNKLSHNLSMNDYKNLMQSVDVICELFDNAKEIEKEKILNEINKAKNIEDTVRIINQQYSLEDYIRHSESAKGFNEYYENKHYRKRDKRLRVEINDSWKAYQSQSEGYWSAFHKQKSIIINNLNDTKRDLYRANRELDRAIANIYRINGGIFTFLFKVIVLLSAYFNKKDLERKANELRFANENLNKQRKVISALQNDTKIALKSDAIESIKNALKVWEKAIYEVSHDIEQTLEKEMSIIDTEQLDNDDLSYSKSADDVLDER